MKTFVSLEVLRRDWDGVATFLNRDLGSSLLVDDSLEVSDGGIFVYGTATARLFAALMDDSGMDPADWCMPAGYLPSIEEVAERVGIHHCLVLGCYGAEIYLVLVDKQSAESQDQWHQNLVASLSHLLSHEATK